MDVSAVIEQIRLYCPAITFAGGAADFAKGLETVVNPNQLPAAFVVPLAEDADDNELQNALRQEVRERIGVIVEFDNTADRRGQVASNQVDAMKYSLFSALLNWRIDDLRAQKGLQYSGGRLIDMDRGRLWWQYDFELLTIINDEDGFQTTSTTLETIVVDIELDPTPPVVTPLEPVEVDIVLGYGQFGAMQSGEAVTESGNLETSDSNMSIGIPLQGAGANADSG